MIGIIHSIIIGAVQGVTEFLPISSSGHLVLVPYLFGWDYKGLSFDIALHFGTVLAILFYFYEDWKIIVVNAFSHKNSVNKYPKNLLWQIVVASIPAAVLGYFLNDIVEEKLHYPLLLAFNLAFFGIILYLADKYFSSKINLKETKYNQSFLVGIAQAIALIPGVSRSGITMTAGRFLGMDRQSSARFSFLLGTPAMIGAFLFAAKDISLSQINFSFLAAVIASTLFGFVAIKYLLKYLERGNFSVFTWYRIALAAIVALFFFYN